LYESDGTEIDLDGIDVDIALAAINAVGERVICDGALVNGLQGIGTAAGQVVVVESSGSNPYTAGKATLVIEYVELPA
jgi:chitinase